jgi:threonylcarbamoyladenosine tRNA methylthiotransferase MtaB
MRTVKFYTLGCKVNQYDTQNIRERFCSAGFKELEYSQAADVCIINTCTVTHRADADSLNIIRKAKKQNPNGKIIVTGCLCELDEDKVKETGANFIVKNQDKENILELMLSLKEPSLDNEPTSQMKRGISYFKGHTRAFLKIQDGCNNFCSFCKVPLVRGASRSKTLNDIIAEADRLANNGYKEIVLCGICLGSYGKDLNPQINLLGVIEELEKIKELLFIRLSSLELKDVTAALINKMAASFKLCPHLHIPLQSGDDEILKQMNRDYCGLDYLNAILHIRKIIPNLAITTDALVGFPDESEENFQSTLRLIKEILPLRVHIFSYSPRKGTLAAIKFKQRLSPDLIKERVSELKYIAQQCSYAYQKQFLNREIDVLIERRWKENLDFWQGRTANYLVVLLKSNLDLQNQFIRVRLINIVNGRILADLC